MKKLILLVPVVLIIIFLVKGIMDSVSYLNISCDRAERARIIMNTADINDNYNELSVNYTTNDKDKIKSIVEFVNNNTV